MARDFLYCEKTDTKIYPNDVVTISTYPDVKWIAKHGWYTSDGKQKNGWYFISIADKSIIAIDSININTIIKDTERGSSEYRPTLKDVDVAPKEVDYIVIPNTNIRLYDGDIVKISNKPKTKWVVHSGWYIYADNQNFGWYFECIKNGEILPVSVVDLTLCTLDTVKTQGSNKYDGKVIGYTRPFTEYDADSLNRAFITVDTIEQRDNLDINKLTDGKLVRVNDVYGEARYYAWIQKDSTWEEVQFSSKGDIPKLTGTEEDPVILAEIPEGLYQVTGYYKVVRTSEVIITNISHLALITKDEDTEIKIITEDSICDYVVDNGGLTFNNYATEDFVDDEVVRIINEIAEPISDDFIRSLFE